jgi:hypothetical protein
MRGERARIRPEDHLADNRGGPVARAHGTHPYPDFQFVQMTSPELAPPDWEPAFADYLYLAFTNASAFSPTDVMPLSRWAKLAMALQSVISIVTVALIELRLRSWQTERNRRRPPTPADRFRARTPLPST